MRFGLPPTTYLRFYNFCKSFGILDCICAITEALLSPPNESVPYHRWKTTTRKANFSTSPNRPSIFTIHHHVPISMRLVHDHGDRLRPRLIRLPTTKFCSQAQLISPYSSDGNILLLTSRLTRCGRSWTIEALRCLGCVAQNTWLYVHSKQSAVGRHRICCNLIISLARRNISKVLATNSRTVTQTANNQWVWAICINRLRSVPVWEIYLALPMASRFISWIQTTLSCRTCFAMREKATTMWVVSWPLIRQESLPLFWWIRPAACTTPKYRSLRAWTTSLKSSKQESFDAQFLSLAHSHPLFSWWPLLAFALPAMIMIMISNSSTIVISMMRQWRPSTSLLSSSKRCRFSFRRCRYCTNTNYWRRAKILQTLTWTLHVAINYWWRQLSPI